MTQLESNSFQAKIRKIIINFGRTLLWQLEKLIGDRSLIGNSVFFDPDRFNWVKDLEANWQIIRFELENILKYKDNLPNFQDISTDQKSITRDNLWKTYFLYGYGIKAEGNCQRCPETTKLIENIPGMKTAFFSILLPGKHIPEHRGPYKGIIRYHLGLIVPEEKENCQIRVADETRSWQEGKSLIFDDSFPHEAWNNTNSIRVVLFLDIVRPIAFPFSILNNLLIELIARSPFVKDANVNQQRWEKSLDDLISRGDRETIDKHK
ncbi:MAG: aspartyl/asparaginyl beta-hydroxylase domain-containing protein [Prochloraceae cyanobacterium]|nr:aspartyl/asparaginyl beta-hydroxylase domain-containing protein [Prochloraceae cyanobacterium]